MPETIDKRIEWPPKTMFLFRPAPYKVLWGGRDGIKSWSMARALLLMGAQNRLRWLCARETQQSIAESVHQLIEDQIASLGLQQFYRVEKDRIVGTKLHATGMYGAKLEQPGYSEFVFAGLKHNVNQIKSFEALDGVWVEEANNVSRNSWEVVLPTIRKEGSEIWVSFNPELATDETYKRWVLNPPPGAVVVKTSWRDNLWLTESSRIKIDYMRQNDPRGFAWIYEGEARSEVSGAIFADEMRKVREQGRITQLPIDRTRPVDTFWDLGFGDNNAIWFAQPYGGWFNLIDYEEGNGMTVADWCVRLQEKGYVYGTDWLPHDAVDAILHHRMTGDRSKSVEQLLRAAGRRPRLAPKLLIHDRINAARTVLSQCRFDSERCADGIQGLCHYQWGELKNQVTPPPRAGGVERPPETRREPLHNWASHPSDAFCTMAVSIKTPAERAPEKPKGPPPRPVSAWA